MKFVPYLLAALICATPAMAAESTRSGGLKIAAVVGSEAISEYDVQKRIRFVLATTRLSNTPEVLSRLRPQVIQSLIDEKLQTQEAKKQDIKVTDEDVKQAIASIERDRGMPPGGVFAMLDSKGVPRETFSDQIRAQLSWNKVIIKTVRPRVRVSEEELMAAQKNYVPPKTIKDEDLLIGLLVLPVDKKANEPEVRKFAEKIVSETRRGASFEELARQFGNSVRSVKIDKFWVSPNQLDPVVSKSLAGAEVGMVTDPLRNNNGYTIIKVYETRPRAGAKPAAPQEAPKEVTREMVYPRVMQQKLEMEAQKYIRNLRRAAFIDIRQ